MSLSATTIDKTFNCDGGTTDFAFPYPFQLSSDLKVYLVTVATGAQTLLTETTHYSVASTTNNYNNGGTVTTVSTYSSAYQIYIKRIVPLTQLLDLDPYDPFSTESFENALDKMMMACQQIDDLIDDHIADTDDPHETVEDDAYGSGWNGDTTHAPSQNAVYDKFVLADAVAALNTAHRTSNGNSHSSVVLNNTHRASDGKDHSDVVLANTHRGLTNNPHSVTYVQTGAKTYADSLVAIGGEGVAQSCADDSATAISLGAIATYRKFKVSFTIDDGTNYISYEYVVGHNGSSPTDDGGTAFIIAGSEISGVAISFDINGGNLRLVITLTGVGNAVNCVYLIKERLIVYA